MRKERLIAEAAKLAAYNAAEGITKVVVVTDNSKHQIKIPVLTDNQLVLNQLETCLSNKLKHVSSIEEIEYHLG